MKLSFPEYHLFQILKRFENQHLPLDLFLSHYFRAHKALGSKDRQVIAEAVYGMTRWRSLIDHLIGHVPSWERRYAVFQKLQPTNYLYVNSIPMHVRVSFPEELFQILKNDYGEEKALHLCQVSNTPAPTCIRVNPSKTTRSALFDQWQTTFDISLAEHSPLGIVFKKRAPLVATPEFKEGLFEIQDEASQLIGALVQPQEGDHVLDFCAGSGGKTLAFAHRLKGKGQIYLHDIRAFILNQAKTRLRRAGVENAQFLELGHPQLEVIQGKMDWVLVDAPCSGTGTLRRNPDQKWKFSQDLVSRLVLEQREIFEKALSFLKDNGRIVYATCSMLKQENEEQLHYFLDKHDLELAQDPFYSFPSFGGMDGFFGAVLQRKRT